MAKKYLDYDGLVYFWTKIKTYFTGTTTPKMDSTAATGTSSKFAREDHVHPSDSTKVDKVSGKGLSTNDYTTTEKNKLANIAAGAEVNQNAFSNVTVGSTTIAADGKTDTLTIVAGSNVTLTPDATNDKLTIAAKDTTYSAATTSAAGLMSADDKAKLDGIADGAEQNVQADWNQTTTTADDYIKNKPGIVTAGTSTTAGGLMSQADKTKLNGIAAGAEVNVQSNWTQTDTSADDYIKNKPTVADRLTTGTKIDVGRVLALKKGENGSAFGEILISDILGNCPVDGTVFNGTQAILHYGECATAAATAAKVVTIDSLTSINPATPATYELVTGALVYVKFTVTNTAAVANLTLNVNGSGAKSIKYRGGNLPAAGTLTANRVYCFVYGGTNWELVGDLDTNTTYTAASANPLMDGNAAVGASAKYAREDHVHPSDTSRVPTSRTVNGKALSSNITLSASDVSAIPTSAKGAASGVCPLNASSKIDATYLPSYVDDVIEAYARSGQTALSSTWLATGSASGTVITPETGKIYILMADSGDYSTNDQFRWSGTTYVKMADGGVSSITNSEIDTIMAA